MIGWAVMDDVVLSQVQIAADAAAEEYFSGSLGPEPSE